MTTSPFWLSLTILCLSSIGIISNVACFAILTYKRRSSKFHSLLKVNVMAKSATNTIDLIQHEKFQKNEIRFTAISGIKQLDFVCKTDKTLKKGQLLLLVRSKCVVYIFAIFKNMG